MGREGRFCTHPPKWWGWRHKHTHANQTKHSRAKTDMEVGGKTPTRPEDTKKERNWMDEWEEEVMWCQAVIQNWMDPVGALDGNQTYKGNPQKDTSEQSGDANPTDDQRSHDLLTMKNYQCPHPNAVEAPSCLDQVQSHKLFAETNHILNRTYEQCYAKVQNMLQERSYSMNHKCCPVKLNKTSHYHASTKSQRIAMLRNLMGKIRKQRCRTSEQLCWLQPACRQYLWGGRQEKTTLNMAQAMLESKYREAGELLQQVQGTKRSRSLHKMLVKPQQLMKEWLFAHFLHPYPSNEERRELAKAAGISESQVATWFINARVRFWKPFIEDLVYKE